MTTNILAFPGMLDGTADTLEDITESELFDAEFDRRKSIREAEHTDIPAAIRREGGA